MIPAWLSKFGWIILSILTLGATAYWKGKQSAKEAINKAEREKQEAQAQADYQAKKRAEEVDRAHKRIKEKDLQVAQYKRKIERINNPQTDEETEFLETELPEDFKAGLDD